MLAILSGCTPPLQSDFFTPAARFFFLSCTRTTELKEGILDLIWSFVVVKAGVGGGDCVCIHCNKVIPLPQPGGEEAEPHTRLLAAEPPVSGPQGRIFYRQLYWCRILLFLKKYPQSIKLAVIHTSFMFAYESKGTVS